jgi:lipoate-protein ligase B
MTGILLDLGRMEYGVALDLQRRLASMRASDQIPDVLMLVEHDHVITLGRKTTPENFKPQHVPVFRIERGGDATYHGPGQLVGYPIMKLEDHDVRRHVRTLESALITAAEKFGVRGGRVEGHPGVWVGGKKLASIGVAVANWVTYHGFALNVNTDMSFFDLIRPCGLDPATMTSMERICGKKVEFGAVRDAVVSGYAAACGETFVHESPPQLANLTNIK